MRLALDRGFAVVSRDSGHEGAAFESSCLGDQQAALDFLYQDIGKVMAVTRPLLRAHYKQPIAHSYFMGCSTGGREAIISSQRYPNEFDGIVAGSPAMRTNYSNLATCWISVSLNAVAPKDAQGHSLASQALSDGDSKLITQRLFAECDALDGVKDGMIFNTRCCHFDPQELACRGAKADGCLPQEQVQAIKLGLAGPWTKAGVPVYPGFAYDTGIAFKGPGDLPAFFGPVMT